MSIDRARRLDDEVHRLNVRRQAAILHATDVTTDDPDAWTNLDALDVLIARKMRKARIYRLGDQFRREALEGEAT